MRERRRSPRWLTLVVVGLLLAGCGAPNAPASAQPGASAAPSGRAASASGASASGSLVEPSRPVIDLADPAASIAAAELALRQEDRERAGLVNLGPGAIEFAAAMDASAARLLAKLRSEAAAGALDGQIAGLGPLAPELGMNTWLVFGTLTAMLDDFIRDPKSGTPEPTTETVTIDGNTGTITTTLTLNAVVNGSKLSVDLKVKIQGEVVDKATGTTIYRIDSEASGHVDVDLCPDASGHASAHIELTSNETYFQGGGSGNGVTKAFSAEAGITVGEDANILTVEGTSQGSDESSGGVPAPGAAESESSVSSRTASDNIANDGSGQRLPGVPRDMKLGGEGTTFEEQVKLWGTMTIFTETMIMAAAKEAEKQWKSGKCVELLVDSEGGDVEADEVKTVTAKLMHKIDGDELDKPIVATLDGVKSVEPEGEKQPAPATVTFTAGAEEGDSGLIAFTSVSNRGIAEKVVIIFNVQPGKWIVTFEGTDTETFAIVKNQLKADIKKLKIVSEDKALTGTGELRLRGKVTSGPCSGQLDQVVPITAAGTLVGTAPDAKLQVVLSAPSPAGGTVKMRCTPGGGADLPAEGHSERFGEALATLELPAAGGSVRVSKTANIGGIMQVTLTGTFTVTKDR